MLLCQGGVRGGLVEGGVDVADDVAFEGADGLGLGFAAGQLPRDVVSGGLVSCELPDRDSVHREVQLSVTPPVEPDAVASAG